MLEEWAELQEFPGYSVSTFGRVRNDTTEKLKKASPNQQGIESVLFFKDGDQYRRSLSVLVAKTFIPQPQFNFNTPIHLDGDFGNHHVMNLAWRPRWFALKYYRQFRRGYFPSVNEAIQDADTGEIYTNSMAAATEFGLIDVEIFLAMANRTVVFPTNQRFQLVDW